MADLQRSINLKPKMVLLSIIFVFIHVLSSEGSTNLDKPESISVAADAIGMYLKKIANKELFVLKMQEIFDSNASTYPEAKFQETGHQASAEEVLKTLVARVTKRIRNEKYKIKKQYSNKNYTFSFDNQFELPKRNNYLTDSSEHFSPICQKHFQFDKQSCNGCNFGDQTIYYTSNKTIYGANSTFDLSIDKIDLSVTSKFVWIINENYFHYLNNDPGSTGLPCDERKIVPHHISLLSSLNKQSPRDLFLVVDQTPVNHDNMKAISKLGKTILTSASTKGKFYSNSIVVLGSRGYSFIFLLVRISKELSYFFRSD